MNQFTLLPGAGKRLRKAVYLQCLGTVSIAALCIILLSTIDTAPLNFTFRDSSTFISPGIILLLIYGFDLRKATRTASSFRLTVSDETITREVDGATTRSIGVREVRFINKWANGSYVITGSDMMKPIVVPVGIERPEELEGLLSTLTPVTIQSKNFHLYKVFILSIALMTAMMGALFSGNKYLATVLGILFIGVAVYSWGVFQRGKDYDRKMRLLSHLVLLPAIAVAVRIIWHWLP